jgi:hypothetical protein
MVRLSVLGSGVAGVVGLIAALLPLLAGEFLAASLCLTAAVISFGLLANALLRE